MAGYRWFAAASLVILTAGAATGGRAQGASTGVACGSGQPVSVNLLWPTQPNTLDPNYDTLVMFAQISRNMFNGLFKLDDSMTLQPDLAVSYSQPDALTYEIELRKDVVFHGGSPFTSADVVATFDRIVKDQKLASKQRSYVSNVKSVTPKGDHAVNFVLKQPDSSFLKSLATIIYITPRSVIEKVGNVEFGKKPVGTGPFKLDSWTMGDSVVLSANCDYHGDKPIPSKVEFRFIAEPATQISSLQSGEIDIATQVTSDLTAALKSSRDVAVQSIDGNQTFWLSMNTKEGPFADPRVRQALNYAIDRTAIARQLLGGFATPVGQVYSKSVFGYTKAVSPYPFDPDKAKALLREAGYDSSRPLKIEFYNFRAELNPVQQSIASFLSDVGIKVTTRFDPNYFVDTWQSGKMGRGQVIIRSNNNLLMDADFALGLELDGTRRGMYFSSPETDAAIAKARGESDRNARQAAYDALNKTLYNLAPVTFLYSTDGIYGVSTRVDWKPRPDGAIYLANVTKRR
ncbi:ABC transporter substrate-binding protein [Chelatococcus asaccharovorans]|nr:ABC transporter substrate-binding protein [Chelatococcus asaccharovorans]CAH1656937.1 Peptide/nickel transport system substrate-binding protein [Chelatococcus asaccharovorans]CAH1684941.1 Peptide/nickel transport system substrate-binding protein [Chelatococcus asaccharovorans]